MFCLITISLAITDKFSKVLVFNIIQRWSLT